VNVIRANCRLQFTAADVDFLLTTLGKSPADAAAIRELLLDADTRDQILDDDAIYRAVLEHTGCLTISGHLYFYVLVRRALRAAGIASRAVADYVAELLTEFTRTERTRARLPGEANPLDYFYEMLAALGRANERSAFALQSHMGNQALYYAGLFPERIQTRTRRKGFPDLNYYEQMGRGGFASASRHRLAQHFGLEEVFALLADGFHEARLALNELADRLVSLGDNSAHVERLLIRTA
jgi:hypothetical protein